MRAPLAAQSSRSYFKGLRKDVSATVGGVVVLAVLAAALFAPFLTPYGPFEQNEAQALASPSWDHPLGTDLFGRDVLTRMLYGARSALIIGFGAVAFAVTIGGGLGLAAGYYGTRIDSTIMRIMDLVLAFPLIILAIMLVVVLGPSMINLIFAVGVSQIPLFTRVSRSLTLSLREREFIEAALSLGASDRRVIRHHLFPNVAPTLSALATTSVGLAILYGAALNFLGVGIQPPSPDWGRMVADNATLIFTSPALSLFPGAAIALTALALNLLGDGLLRVIDPTSSRAAWV